MATPIPPPVPLAAAAEAVAEQAPAPFAEAPMYANYDSQGALGGLFAPAYIKGYAPAEQAVQAWHNKNNPISYSDVDALRMPNAWQPPQPTNPYGGDVYGSGRIPDKLRYGDDRGEVDPLALISLSQGGPYDVEGRRNAIAKRLADNDAAQAAYKPPRNWWEA